MTNDNLTNNSGLSRLPEYHVWSSMRDRVTNPNNPSARFYLQRGIGICKEWRLSFRSFWNDMGPRPSAKHTIDRIDNNKDYGPGNCRWATQKEQMRNTSRNINLTYNGKTQCLADWAVDMGIPKQTLGTRIRTLGWSIDRALTESVHIKFSRKSRRVGNSKNI